MGNTPEEIEALKARAFRPPKVDSGEDFRLFLKFAFMSVMLFFGIYYLIGFIYIQYFGGGWTEMKSFILTSSFTGTIIFAVFRTLKLTMAQTASDPYMLFPMKTENVSWHLRDLVKLATSLEWDLTGLIGSFIVVLVTYFLPF